MTEVYGVGGFLMAGTEITRLIDKKRRQIWRLYIIRQIWRLYIIRPCAKIGIKNHNEMKIELRYAAHPEDVKI